MNLEQLYREHADMVFNLALNQTGSREDAEEITQDVFVKVHRSLEKFREDAQSSTWIYKITLNTCLDYHRAKKRKKRFGIFSSLFDLDGEVLNEQELDHPGFILEGKEELARIYRHIHALPERQKTVLILAKMEEKSQKEIAEIMDLTPKAVESLLQRAKNNLAQKLIKNEGSK